MFVNLPMDFGKSLIFRSLPIVADIVSGKPRGSSVIVVISPLRSLMEDRVQNLNSICIPAIARGIFKSESFSEMLIGVAIDEAHCITQW